MFTLVFTIFMCPEMGFPTSLGSTDKNVRPFKSTLCLWGSYGKNTKVFEASCDYIFQSLSSFLPMSPIYLDDECVNFKLCTALSLFTGKIWHCLLTVSKLAFRYFMPTFCKWKLVWNLTVHFLLFDGCKPTGKTYNQATKSGSCTRESNITVELAELKEQIKAC